MSLHFALHVNGRSIYHAMHVQRLDSPAQRPEPDGVYHYRADIVREDGTNPAEQASVIVEHRYGDGAWELIRKALNEIHERKKTSA